MCERGGVRTQAWSCSAVTASGGASGASGASSMSAGTSARRRERWPPYFKTKLQNLLQSRLKKRDIGRGIANRDSFFSTVETIKRGGGLLALGSTIP